MAMYILIPWRIYKLIVCHRLADSYFCIIQDNAASSRKNKDIAFPESTTYEFKNPVIPLLKFKVLHAVWASNPSFELMGIGIQIVKWSMWSILDWPQGKTKYSCWEKIKWRKGKYAHNHIRLFNSNLSLPQATIVDGKSGESFTKKNVRSLSAIFPSAY